MPKRNVLPEKPIVIKYNGIFDFDLLYREITGWFIDYGFTLEEPTYKHKVPSPAGADQEIEFTGWKKINEYIRYWIEMYIHLFNLKDVGVVKDGVKKTLQQSEMIIEMRAVVESDYPGIVDSKFGEYLKQFWDRHLLKQDMSNVWEDQLWYIMYKLHTRIKEVLGMETSTDPFREVW